MSTDSALKLGGRLKIARESLHFTQQKMAEEVGCSKSAWVEYEYDLKIPGGKVLAGLANLGFNTNWLLTGEIQLDKELLRKAMRAVREYYDERPDRLAPADEEELIFELHDFFFGKAEELTSDTLKKLGKIKDKLAK